MGSKISVEPRLTTNEPPTPATAMTVPFGKRFCVCTARGIVGPVTDVKELVAGSKMSAVSA